MTVLSEWLQIMLAEIVRKREDLQSAREEELKRATEKAVNERPTGSRSQPEQ